MSNASVTIGHEGAITTASLVVDGRLVRLHGRAPQVEAGRLIAPIFDTAVSPPSLIAVIGLGLGYVLDALERRGYIGRVLALEVEPGTVAAMRARRSWTTWDDRLRVAVAPDFDGLDDARAWLEGFETPPPVIEHPVLARERPEAMSRARAALMQLWFAARANAEARNAQAPTYLRNTLLNARGLAAEAQSDVLDGAWQGATVVIAAAGPSLDDAIPRLRLAADHAVLIAVDTAARPLLAAGITPDMIVALDPTGTNGRHLIDLPPAASGAHLATEGSVDPIAVRQFAGRTFFFRVADHAPWPWLESQGLRAGRLRAWGSVLTSAVDLALRGGAARVIFVGADLAFTGGRPYCRGTTFERDWNDLIARGASLPSIWAEALARWETVREEDVAGGTTTTARHLLAFRDWIVETATAAPGCEFINATPAGVLTGGRISLDTLAGALATADVSAAGAARAAIAEAYRTATRPDETRLTAAARALWPAFLARTPVSPLVEWAEFTGGPLEPAVAGLGLATLAGASLPQGDRRLAPASSGIDACDAALTPADRQFLTTLAAHGPVQVLRSGPDAQEAARMVSRAVEDLRPGQTLVVIDEAVPSHGIALRRALLDACVRHGLRLDDGRYRDWGSRLFIVAAGEPPAAESARQRLGWDDGPLARRIVGEIVRRHRPTTAFDAGGLSSVWTDALTSAGVSLRRHDSTEPADIALLLYAADRVDAPERLRLIERATAASDVVLFSAVPPAHGAVTPGEAQPFEVWGRLFGERGFALVDDWRSDVEAATGLTTWFDLLLGFRRVCPRGAALPDAAVSALAGLVGRGQEQFESIVRLHVNEHHRSQVLRACPLPPAAEATVPLRLAPECLRPAEDGAAIVEFRSAFTRHWLGTHSTALRVTEDGRHLPGSASPGDPGWRFVDGTLRLNSLDGSDVRLNSRTYSLYLPADLACLESVETGVAPGLPS